MDSSHPKSIMMICRIDRQSITRETHSCHGYHHRTANFELRLAALRLSRSPPEQYLSQLTTTMKAAYILLFCSAVGSVLARDLKMMAIRSVSADTQGMAFSWPSSWYRK